MIRVFVFWMFISCLTVAFGQEYLDVVFLKNGDVAKGVIVETVPYKYIKIETANGSILTFNFDDIEKMIKEKNETRPQVSNVQAPPQRSRVEQTDRSLKSTESTNPFTNSFQLSGRVGLYIPSDEAMKDIYSNMVDFGVGIKGIDEKNWGYQFDIDYMKKEGDPYTWTENATIEDASAEISFLSLSATSTFNFTSLSSNFYVGLGSTYHFINEKISLTANIGGSSMTESDEGSLDGWGYHAVIGADFYTGESVSIGARAKWSIIPVELVDGSDGDIGGLRVGLIFRLL